MRIIAGRLKGRRLQGPTGPGVRPTSDGLRETLFNVLRDRVADTRVLDGYAGTGAVGIEAMSRGASEVVFVERDPRVIAILKKNIATCGIEGESVVVRDSYVGSAARHPRLERFGVIFLDPPYDVDDVEAILTEAAGQLAPDGMVILEYARRREVPDAVAGLTRQRVLTAGDSALGFYTSASAF